MEPSFKSLKEYIESGEYFTDSRKWYKYKYIHPFSQRSFILVLSVVSLSIFLSIAINVKNLFPTSVQVKYSIFTENISDNKTAKVIKADQFGNDAVKSIADIMIRNYVIQRESYDYNLLEKQFTFIQNNSTRIAFRDFYNFMSLNNPDSPLIKHQKNIRKSVEILSVKYPNKNKVVVKFRAQAKDITGQVFEDMILRATIDYEIDPIRLDLPPGSRFNFTVTNYKLDLLEGKKKK